MKRHIISNPTSNQSQSYSQRLSELDSALSRFRDAITVADTDGAGILDDINRLVSRLEAFRVAVDRIKGNRLDMVLRNS